MLFRLFSPLDELGASFVDQEYSKAYVRHLFSAKEYLGKQIASIHNLAFYLDLVKVAREFYTSVFSLNSHKFSIMHDPQRGLRAIQV